MTAMRVVLDTNIVLMPIINPASNDSWVIGEWQKGNIIPLISKETESELLETLRKPRLGLREEQIQGIAATYLDYCETIAIPNPPLDTQLCDDPSDQKFLILAYQGRAEALVSKDGRVLALKEESAVPILNWPEFISEIYFQNKCQAS